MFSSLFKAILKPFWGYERSLLFFGETLGVVKILLIALLLLGVIGLKMITEEHDVSVEKVHA